MTNIFAGVGLAVERPFRVFILHPGTNLVLCERDENGVPVAGTEAYLDIMSEDSPRARSVQTTVAAARAKLRPGQFLSADELTAERADIVAQLCTGWNVLTLDGRKVDITFSLENAKQLFTTPGCDFWLEQGMAAARSRANFIPAPKQS